MIGSIGFMTYQAVTGAESPPSVTVQVEAIRPVAHGYLVQFRAVNYGGSTAAQLKVGGTLTGDNGRVETSEAVLDYVPGQGYRQGGLFFTHDPRQYLLQLRAVGYAAP